MCYAIVGIRSIVNCEYFNQQQNIDSLLHVHEYKLYYYLDNVYVRAGTKRVGDLSASIIFLFKRLKHIT